MRLTHVTRGAVGVAALCLVAASCATPAKEPVTTAPADVRIVELSDEAAEKIAERVAAYIPKQPVVAQPGARAQPAAPRAVSQPRAAGARDVPVEVTVDAGAGVFGPVPSVPADRLLAASEASVDAALAWLARHQSADGAWNAAGFADECRGARCSGPGEALYTPGLTGMALLAFLEDGHTHRTGAHADVVRRGLQYLKTIQDSQGCFGPRASQHFQYNHALCALAMVKAYALTESDLFRESAQSAVNFVHASQNPYLGWRYGVRDGDNDTSMTAWMTMVLAEARAAGLRVDEGAFRGALAWVDKMTDPELGRVGYQRRGSPTARTMEAMERFPAELSEAMTAAGLIIRLNAGQSAASSEALQKGARLLATKPPTWNVDRGSNDFYYWHLGTRAMSRIGGPGWETWRSALQSAVIDRQAKGDGDEAGSWEPVDAWSAEGGRVYATAGLCLALETLEHALR